MEIEASGRQSQDAYQLTEQEVQRANQTRLLLEKLVNDTKTFLESEKARPEDIQSRVDKIMNVTIPFNEEQIRELSENVCFLGIC